ncbi:transcription elongation factor [Robertkochia sediminum]|uniref:transcription elongation factor n=1 Tax=Robertkochia sediminum TaxID=2785326 RepID=UPI001934A081|nr:transcription elongation factor [Robertkochia sediminum]MBL7473536.1 transcription elongation factor [Robertkochia sediminum]
MLKEEIYRKCQELLNSRIEKYRNEIAMLKESLENEDHHSEGGEDSSSDSSVDEHYTQTMRYLDEAINLKEQLKHVDIFQDPATVKLGSLVHTNRGIFFLSVPLGAVNADGKTIIAISREAPVSQLLIGKAKHDTINFNGNLYTVEAIE